MNIRKFAVFALASQAALGMAFSQATQISVTNAAADAVLRGNYNPAAYQAATLIDNIAVIAPDMAARVSRDSLQSYLIRLTSFQNRNSGSDTVSTTRGIGAARRWIYSKFQEFSSQNGGRLIPAYLQFTQTICIATRHRNIFAVLPGRDTANHAVLIVEGHFDSRCETNCDINCVAHGADDNGSGTVLVMELARILSKYTFNRTLVFLITTAEEQGLFGAYAFRDYCVNNAVPVLAVQNNDVVGGILCGLRSSAPSCPTPGALDSTHFRIFSTALNFSMNKALGRFIQGQYEQWLMPTAQIPMTLNIMDPTDRTGRGGDHQPFSEANIPAIRFTESYENGDGTPAGGRQHTVNDIISDANGTYVNYDYLARNTRINAMGLIGGALGPQVPSFTLAEPLPPRYIVVTISVPTSPVGVYKVAVRISGNNSFAVVYTVTGSSFIIPNTLAGVTYYVATASVDGNGAQSLYSQEQSITASVNGPPPVAVSKSAPGKVPGLETVISPDRISFTAGPAASGQRGDLQILDVQGRTLHSHAFRFSGSMYETTLFRSLLPAGIYHAVLKIGGQVKFTRRLTLPKAE